MAKWIYDKNGDYLLEISAGLDEEIKQEHGADIFISTDFLGYKAIVENNSIRAYTRLDSIEEGLEELQEGEYIKDNEIIKIEKPSNFHIWDNKTNKWNYDKQLEIKSLNEELADLEGALLIKYDDLDKAITRKLKTLQKRLNTEIEKLSVLIDKKYSKLEELEG